MDRRHDWRVDKVHSSSKPPRLAAYLASATVERSPAERWLLNRPADNSSVVNVALASRLGTGSRTAKLVVAAKGE